MASFDTPAALALDRVDITPNDPDIMAARPAFIRLRVTLEEATRPLTE
jgi:hypothetical protein